MYVFTSFFFLKKKKRKGVNINIIYIIYEWVVGGGVGVGHMKGKEKPTDEAIRLVGGLLAWPRGGSREKPPNES